MALVYQRGRGRPCASPLNINQNKELGALPRVDTVALGLLAERLHAVSGLVNLPNGIGPRSRFSGHQHQRTASAVVGAP